MKPLSASSSLTPPKNASSALTGLPVRGSRMPFGAGATRVMDKSIPFKRSFLPFIYEVDGRNAKEQHHRPKAEMADLYFLTSARCSPQAGDYAQASYWAGLRPMTPDGPPYLGETPLRNLLLNVG